MATGDPPITIIGNLTADPELRFTASGAAVVGFTVAVQPRKYNKNTGQWEDGQASFYRCNAWRQHAENIAESYVRGNRVIVSGTIAQRSYETNDGEKRTVFEVQVDDMGPSTKFATVQIRRAERQGQGQPAQQQRQQQPPEDPWGTPPAQPAQQRPAPQQAALDANDPWGDPPPF